MPLPEAAERKPMHQRTLEFQGFARADGLWDIEGRLIDCKPFDHLNYRNEGLAAGVPVHDMSVRLTLNDTYELVAIQAAMDASPFGVCPQAVGGLQSLIGLRLGAGWRQAVKSRLPGTASCTHLGELLQATATVAFQTLGLGKSPEGTNPLPHMGRGDTPPFFVGQCHAWRADGEVVREVFPHFANKSLP